jgi:hypothetical protein
MVGGAVSSKLERVWKEAAIALFAVLCWNLHGGAKENHRKA